MTNPVDRANNALVAITGEAASVIVELLAENRRLNSGRKNAERRADRILDAYHMSYRHGPDPDPKRCPACHAAALEEE